MKAFTATSKKSPAEILALRIIVVDPPPGISWALEGDSKDAFRLRGPAVQGRPGKRFVYLRMGAYAGQVGIEAGWRAKIGIEGITRKLLDAVKAKPTAVLEVQFAGTGPKGGPACATVPLPGGWQVSSAA